MASDPKAYLKIERAPKKREENKYKGIEEIMKQIDNTKGDIFIISSEHEAGKKLDGLGGIGAILRYKINY